MWYTLKDFHPLKKLILHLSHHLFIPPHVANSWCHVNKLHEKQHCIHHIPMLSNSYLLQCNHLCNHLMHGHSKTSAINILCLRSSIVCVIRVKKKKEKKRKKNPWKKGRREKRPKVNLILSHVNHTFLKLDLQIGPHTFRHIDYTLGFFFYNVNKGPIQALICFKLVLGFLVLRPLSKVALKYTSWSSLLMSKNRFGIFCILGNLILGCIYHIK